MATPFTRNIRVGIMVMVGLVLLLAALYMIGDKQNLFGSTIKLRAHFSNVNGLTVGNNVRYVGIDVGTVSDIQIINDSSVMVEMTIEAGAMEYIRKNAIASIGTDGLMGNKLVNISSVPGTAAYIKEGDILETRIPLDTDEIMRTLSSTNDDMYQIAENLKSITTKIEQDNMIWNLLGDSAIARNIRSTMANIDQSSKELVGLTRSFNQITKDVQSGEGLLGTVLYDSSLVVKINSTLNNLQGVSDSLVRLSSDISDITKHVKRGEGAAGKMLMDEKTDQDLTETMENLKKSSVLLNENLEALKRSLLFRRYFRKQEKSKSE